MLYSLCNTRFAADARRRASCHLLCYTFPPRTGAQRLICAMWLQNEEDLARVQSSRNASTSSSTSNRQPAVQASSLDRHAVIQDLPLPKTGKALAAVIAGVKDVINSAGRLLRLELSTTACSCDSKALFQFLRILHASLCMRALAKVHRTLCLVLACIRHLALSRSQLMVVCVCFKTCMSLIICHSR